MVCVEASGVFGQRADCVTDGQSGFFDAPDAANLDP
jgi:hypothetical protein